MGPTKRMPRFFRALARAVDSGGDRRDVREGARGRRGRRVGGVGPDQRVQLARRPARPARCALASVASILARLRMMPGVGEQPLPVGVGERRHRGDPEAGEGGAEALAAAQDRDPGQPRLERLQAEPLEQGVVAVDRAAPLVSW